jgi:hypothetical protein
VKVLPFILSAALLAGCGQAAPPALSVADARAQLLRVGGDGSASAFCSEDGRTQFRDAARAFTHAVAREAPETKLPFLEGGEDPAWSLIFLGAHSEAVRSQGRGWRFRCVDEFAVAGRRPIA